MPEVTTPSKDDWENWLQQPCTKALRKWAEGKRLDLMEQWAGGNFSGAFTTEMLVKNSGATGACSAYIDVIEMDYNLIVEGTNDAK